MLSGLLSVVILLSLRLNPETWLNDYPPDIRKKFGPMGAEARRLRIPTAILFLGILFGVIGRGLYRMHQSSVGGLDFPMAFTYTFAVGQIFNVVDLLILDWLIFVALSPRFIVLPGTEGLAGYSDYGFHFRAFLVCRHPGGGVSGWRCSAGGPFLWVAAVATRKGTALCPCNRSTDSENTVRGAGPTLRRLTDSA